MKPASINSDRSAPYKVVFLDAGGTLFQPYPSVGHVYSSVAKRHGVDLDASWLEERFSHVWHERNGRTHVREITNEKIEKEWWNAVVRDVFQHHHERFVDFPRFFDDLFDFFGTSECWRIFDEVPTVLTALKKRGYRLAILSNWDHRLDSIVDSLAVRHYFETVIVSAKVGSAKPSRSIFDHALAQMKAAPSECIHVGDSMEDDYRGAQGAGIKGVLLNRSGRAYNEVPSIQTLDALLTLLP